MRRIDEQSYKEGGAAFNKGKSIRWLMEQRIAAMAISGSGDWQEMQSKQESLELGFADALLNKLRNIR